VEKLQERHDVMIFDLREPTSSKATFLKGDVTNIQELRHAFKNAETVFHLAALLPQFAATKERLYEVNHQGTENVLKCAAEKDARVIHVSSSSVYGVPTSVPCSEDSQKNPLGIYGKSKLEAESLCWEHHKNGGEVVVFRPMTLVGPGIYGIFDRWLRWLKKDWPVPIFGDGKNRIQMLSVHDMVDACVLAESRDVSGEIMNLGSDNVPGVRHMFQTVIERVASKSKIVPLNATVWRNIFRIGHLLHVSPLAPEHYLLMDKDFILDNSKAKRLLGWQPRYDNIEMVVEAFKGIDQDVDVN